MCAPLKSHPTTKTDDIDKMQLNEPELDQRSYRIRTILLNMQKKTNNIYQWTTFSSLIIFQRLNARHQKRYENCDMIYSDNKPIFIRFVWDEITAKITSCNRNGIETASVRANEQWNFKEFGTRTTTRVNCPINVYIVRRIRYKRHTLQLAFLWKYLSERIHDDHIRKGRNASVQSDCTTISFNKNNKQFASEILLRLLWLCFGLLLSSSFVVFCVSSSIVSLVLSLLVALSSQNKSWSKLGWRHNDGFLCNWVIGILYQCVDTTNAYQFPLESVAKAFFHTKCLSHNFHFFHWANAVRAYPHYFR